MTTPGFETWLERQAQASARGLAACLSRTGLVKRRPGFGQTVTPRPGSVLAAPATEQGPGEPDYFFHWIRDAALAMNALPALLRAGDRSADWPQLFRDWVAFEQSLAGLDGGPVAASGDYRRAAQPDFVRFLRPEAELAAIRGPAVAGDVRVNADGTLDTISWSRPQHDGPALRVLTALRCAEAGLAADGLETLIRADLDYTEAAAGRPCIDLWEEVAAEHYYTLLVQYAALRAGFRGEAAVPLIRRLDAFWSDADGTFRCSQPPEPRKTLDMAVVLGVLHAGLEFGPHSLDDPRVAATLARLEATFAADYPINRGGTGIACGRYPGDRYVTGGPWYLCTFAAAEFRYRCVAAGGPARLRDEGDAILETARRTIPPAGDLSEQFDPRDGSQASARNLGWSHAAFLTALDARSG